MEVVLPRETVTTGLTLERPLPCVRADVALQVPLLREPTPACVKSEGLACVGQHVVVQRFLQRKPVATDVALVGLLPCVRPQMSFELFTAWTSIRTVRAWVLGDDVGAARASDVFEILAAVAGHSASLVLVVSPPPLCDTRIATPTAGTGAIHCRHVGQTPSPLNPNKFCVVAVLTV